MTSELLLWMALFLGGYSAVVATLLGVALTSKRRDREGL